MIRHPTAIGKSTSIARRSHSTKHHSPALTILLANRAWSIEVKVEQQVKRVSNTITCELGLTRPQIIELPEKLS